MATTDVVNLFKAIPELATTFNGKSGSSTQQTLLSKEATDSLIRSMLSGNQGLAGVTSGQKAAGLYNSSTNSLLTNDLASKVAGEVATRGAPTVRSDKQDKSANFGNLITGLLAKKVFGKLGGDKLLDDGFDGIKGLFGNSDSMASSLDPSAMEAGSTGMQDFAASSGDSSIASTGSGSGYFWGDAGTGAAGEDLMSSLGGFSAGTEAATGLDVAGSAGVDSAFSYGAGDTAGSAYIAGGSEGATAAGESGMASLAGEGAAGEGAAASGGMAAGAGLGATAAVFLVALDGLFGKGTIGDKISGDWLSSGPEKNLTDMSEEDQDNYSDFMHQSPINLTGN